MLKVVTESDDGQKICAGPIKGCDESGIKVETGNFSAVAFPSGVIVGTAVTRLFLFSSKFQQHRKTGEFLHSVIYSLIEREK